ncbi:hypothetical protein HZZ00_38035 (plasmid) [Streptomyces sp. NEAU-sy36]|uniref:hypothetical protein n=1 Tax=unclassified Streptomyces TaxID=2593676 RepID=UPI0015D5B868|nr:MULTISPECIES: hypothetical protein [unclassified Streptomyces]QLJ06832.1 hypothetical protein HZZ00_38035 [Streptomyces sp. NEAU-sy36]
MTTHHTSVLDGTELGDLLADLADGSNIHPGIRLIAAGYRAIAEDQSLSIPATQLLIAQLSAAADGVTVVAAAGRLIEWLTSENPVLASLPDAIRKTVQRQGELACSALRDTELTALASEACAALDTRKEVHPVTDTERKELSQKVADANRQSTNRPK